MFSQRLDYTMELTGTQASALGRACSLDASHISRLRNGSRSLPKNPAFLPAMGAYLAKRVRAEYQKSALCDALKLDAWPVDEAQGALLLSKWLAGEAERPADVGPILFRLTEPAPQRAPAGGTETALPAIKRYYYGPEGKREAVLQFFALARNESRPQTLLLSSDEEMGWLYEDSGFAARWAADFTRLLRAGNRVRIVHSIGRDLNELLEAVAKWMPVYMTGRIEPYYYPKLRDGIFQRTLFLAPKTAAIASVSVARSPGGMLNELITDSEAVAALTREFEGFFALCRPLMRILTVRDSDALWQTWDALARAEGDLICMSGMPTLATMPERIARAMQARAPDSRILELWRLGVSSLEALLADGQYTELTPPDGAAPASMGLPCADCMGAPGLCYTEEELAAHREHRRTLAEKHPNYTIVPQNDVPANLLLYGKEGRGVILVKSDEPSIAFAVSEAKLTNAFWDYLAARRGVL